MRATAIALSSAAVALAKSVDYIVVGAGTTGLAVANRLSEDPSVTVTVIDPGKDQHDNPLVYDLNGWAQAPGTEIDWNYDLVSPEFAKDKKLKLPQGKGWGGTSLINGKRVSVAWDSRYSRRWNTGMTYIRGDKAEFDAWEDLGNKGWNWEAILPYYKKAEKYSIPTDTHLAAGATYEKKYHGFEGHVHTGYPTTLKNTPFNPAVIETWEGLSLKHNPDLNSGHVHGFSIGPQTLDAEKDVRWDASRAYYLPIEKERKNLEIIQGTVKRITWASQKRSRSSSKSGVVASGVEYFTPDNQTETLEVSREVIVSAGAVRTPLVLESSGIGNPNLLESLGIDIVVDLPGVGENLIDQTNHMQIFNSSLEPSNAGFHIFVTAADLFGNDLPSIEASTRKNLPKWAKTIVEASTEGALDIRAVEKLLQIQHDLIFKKKVTLSEIMCAGVAQGDTTFFGSPYWNLLPFARGSVHLKSADAINDPVIDPRFFLIDFDLDATVATAKLVRKFWTSEPMGDSVSGEISPGSDVVPGDATDEEWAAFHRNTGTCTFP